MSQQPSVKHIPAPPTSTNTSKSPARNSSKNNNNNRKMADYERYAQAQGRALERWEKQQATWDHVAHNVATKAHKSESAALSASTHFFREKQEDIGKLDTAVPAAARSHASNSWEMNLRDGASATRYEPVGSSYPYPLYCPIRSPDQVGPDHPSLMHVLYPPSVTQRVNRGELHSKPIMESNFFKTRQSEFSGLISKKFSHFSEREYFDVRGVPAPRTTERPAMEDESQQIGAVQFIPTASKDGTDMAQQGTHAMTIRNLIAQQQQPGSPAGDKQLHQSQTSQQSQQQQAGRDSIGAATAAYQQQQQQGGTGQQQQQQSRVSAITLPVSSQQPTGPMLVLSTNNLTFTTSATHEVKQAIITLENSGSTAIFYNWSPLPPPPAVLVGNNTSSEQQHTPSSSSGATTTPSSQMPSPFSLANPVTGSVLPDQNKMFCFSFRAPAPGIYTQHMELVTVPCGRERIVVTLRGVALSSDADAVLADTVNLLTTETGKTTVAEEIVRADIIHNVNQNVFKVSDVEMAVRKREAEIKAEEDAPLVLRANRKELWATANSAVAGGRLPFCEPAFAALELIRSRCNEFRAEFETPNPYAKKKKAPPPPEPTGKDKKKDSSTTPRGKKGDDDDAEPPPDRTAQLVGVIPEEWNGSIRSLYEDVACVRTQAARLKVTDAVAAIHRGLSAAQEYAAATSSSLSSSSSSSSPSASSSDEQQQPSPEAQQQQISSSTAAAIVFDTWPLSQIIWLSAGRTWLGNAMDKFERAAVLAAARVEGRAICVSKGINVYGAPPKKGGAGGGGGGDRAATPMHALGADLNAPVATGPGGSRRGGAAPPPVAKPTCTVSPEEAQKETAELKHESMKQLLLAGVMGMIGAHEKEMETVESATVLPLSSLIYDDADKVREARDMEAEPVLDLNTKKRK